MPFPQFIAPLIPDNHALCRSPVSRAEASKRILIMGLGALGDIVAQSPLLVGLREAYPEAYLTWIVDRGNLEAVDANPFVDEIIVWDGSFWQDAWSKRWKNWFRRRSLLGVSGVIHMARLYRLMHRCRFDTLISLQPEEWPFLTWVSGALVSVGVFPGSSRNEKHYKRIAHRYSRAFTYSDLPPHTTERALTALAGLELPGPSSRQGVLGVTTQDTQVAAALLAKGGISSQERVAVIAPQTTWPTKCWSEQGYGALGDALSRDYGCRVALIGTDREREAVGRVAAHMQSTPITAAGTLSFRQMAALIARAALVISGDTGPMHVAAAMGTPYLALFGPTSPRRFAPLVGCGETLFHAVPCGPCEMMTCANVGEKHLLCMRLITVDEALDAASRLLEATRPAV